MRDDDLVRTTLDIDEDVLESAKETRSKARTTAGRVLSELARSSLEPRGRSPRKRNSVPILPPRRGERLVTSETVNRLRDEQ